MESISLISHSLLSFPRSIITHIIHGNLFSHSSCHRLVNNTLTSSHRITLSISLSRATRLINHPKVMAKVRVKVKARARAMEAKGVAKKAMGAKEAMEVKRVAKAMEARVKAKAMEVKVRARAMEVHLKARVMAVRVKAKAMETQLKARAMEDRVKVKAMEDQLKAKVMEVKAKVKAMEANKDMEAKDTEAKEVMEAMIVNLFRIDDDLCVLIWFYDLFTASYGKTGSEEYNSPYHSQQGSGYGGPQSMPSSIV